MTLWQALGYFLREAAMNSVRAWRISLLAVLTIGVSLFIGGSFLLVGSAVDAVIEGWRSQAKVVLYLDDWQARESLGGALDRPWVREVEALDEDEARARFQETFPSLRGLVEEWGSEPLPPSLEIGFDPAAAAGPAFDAWIDMLALHEGVAMVDDDRDWLTQVALAVEVIRSVGLSLGAVLLVAAVFTIASVIRLTVHLYRDEIAVMRLVGATEFFIRGPFYVEGVLQGLVGGLLALGALAACDRLVLAPLASSLYLEGWGGGAFLSPTSELMLVACGAAAGLLGSVISLRRGAFDVE